MTLISYITVDLLKHYGKHYLCFYTYTDQNVFLLEVEWGSRMTREGYDQCLGKSHNLSPILP